MILVTGATGTIGRPLRYQEIPPEAAKQGMVQHGFPEPFVLLTRPGRAVPAPARLGGGRQPPPAQRMSPCATVSASGGT